MKTWQTTVLGVVFLVGSALQFIPGPDWLRWIGGILTTLGGGGGLVSAARDTGKVHAEVAHIEGRIQSMIGPRV